MIFSRAKLVDMKFRGELLSDIEWLYVHGFENLAKELLLVSASLKKKMETYDYTKTDEFLEREEELLAKMEPITVPDSEKPVYRTSDGFDTGLAQLFENLLKNHDKRDQF